MRREAAPFAKSGPIVREDGWKGGADIYVALASNQPRAHARLIGIRKAVGKTKTPLQWIIFILLVAVWINACVDRQSKSLVNVEIRYDGKGSWTDK